MKMLAGIDGGDTHACLALVDGEGVLAVFAEVGCCRFVELGRDGATRACGRLR